MSRFEDMITDEKRCSRGEVVFLVVCGLLSHIYVSHICVEPAFSDSLSGHIKRIREGIVVPYVQPLVTSLGTALGGELFHTADAHSMLGFDIGAKFMIVPILDSARTFEGVFDVPLFIGGNRVVVKAKTKGKAQTILGKNKETELELVSAPPGVTVNNLPKIPGGVDLSIVPLGVLQASLGIYKGTEIMIRGMFLPKVLKDDLILGGGAIKWEVTELFLVFPNC